MEESKKDALIKWNVKIEEDGNGRFIPIIQGEFLDWVVRDQTRPKVVEDIETPQYVSTRGLSTKDEALSLAKGTIENAMTAFRAEIKKVVFEEEYYA